MLRIQKALKAEGFDPGKLDGIDGPKTQKALSDWEDWTIGLVKGLDVSKYQGRRVSETKHEATIDWAAVKAAGYLFVFVKATEGKTGKDPLLEAHARGAVEAGLVVGFYHYHHPANDERDEARHFYETCAPLIKSYPRRAWLPPALDIETDDAGSPATKAEAALLIAETRRRWGAAPLAYSYGPFFDARDIELGESPLWIADYRPGPPTIPPGWKSYAFHQFGIAPVGAVPGLKTPVDVNRFRGSREELEKLCFVWG